jgi:hypothetical protein
MNLAATGYSAMKDAIARAERASGDLRGAFMGDAGDAGDAPRALVDLMAANTQFRAAVAVTRVADEMAALLDVQRAE